jgi:hydrogenase expression/formation protein HypE
MNLKTSETRASTTHAGWTNLALAHGGGGQLTDQLLEQSVLPRLDNAVLRDLLDCGIVPPVDGRIALTIDSYVVQPLKFPGGDIGRLCISGTVNDLCVCGAVPAGIALSFILAEGLNRRTFDSLMQSIAATAEEAGVRIITGDTKVVGRGQADGMYITTAGVGIVPLGRELHPRRVKAGDVLIINGPIADHGLAVMLAREMPDMNSALRSDVAPLNSLIGNVLDAAPNVAFMRDPTRGGLAALGADLAQRSGLHVTLEEKEIPVRPETLHAAELLGIDPLEVANEGKVVMVVRQADASKVLAALRGHPLGKEAKLIGRIDSTADGLCELRTAIGGRRIVQKPYGEQLPRIC